MDTMVVGIGGGETALVAARRAAELATALGATVHFVTVVEREETAVVGVGSDRWELSRLETTRAEAERVVESLDPSFPYTVSALEGDPAKVLVAEAERTGADLIVVGNVRMQGLGRLLGSVGNAVAHTAPCSVLIVKTV